METMSCLDFSRYKKVSRILVQNAVNDGRLDSHKNRVILNEKAERFWEPVKIPGYTNIMDLIDEDDGITYHIIDSWIKCGYIRSRVVQTHTGSKRTQKLVNNEDWRKHTKEFQEYEPCIWNTIDHYFQDTRYY